MAPPDDTARPAHDREPTRDAPPARRSDGSRSVGRVAVRRRPRMLPFLVGGALAGLVVGMLVSALGPTSATSSSGQEMVLLGFFGAAFFGLLGAIAYLVADRASLRHRD